VAFDEFEGEDFNEELRDDFNVIDQELTRALARTQAPPRLLFSVMNRVRMPAPTRVPEFLDAIGWIGALSFVASFAIFVIMK
jgi:hypothetical protein